MQGKFVLIKEEILHINQIEIITSALSNGIYHVQVLHDKLEIFNTKLKIDR
ncbi:MAG: hypothetical protein MUE53_06110 [Chitinophagales bacterium]|jgi:hypothetical protein|nr:hypothetical protein [Chitinophagales bacterium]